MRKLLAVLVLVALLFSTAPVSAGQKEPGSKAKGGNAEQAYIVQVVGDPVVAYKGDIAGLKATKPSKNQKINPNSPEVVAYVSYLTARHDDLVSRAGGRKLYSYAYAFNGFAAVMSEAEAAKLAATEGVAAVSPDEVRQLDTASTPGFLGLTADNGLWNQLGGVGSAGENIIIGIVDGGIWPEHPSFSDRTGLNGNGSQDGKLAYQQIPGWHGKCVPGEEFNASNCNQKLIGAQYFNAGWGGDAGIDATLPWEFNSPRDFGGHGTHTASTAGGNYNVPAEGAAAVFGSISGIAPRARIAAYKVCWETGGGGSCVTSDSVAAIDTAVADGVDVINFSISGSRTSFMDPVEIAFLFAADAGVFVAASAGNSGPADSTVAHPGPWLTTVAAGTHSRNVVGSVTLGNGETYTGASIATAVGPAPLINAAAAALPGSNPAAVDLCFAAEDNGGVPVLDPAVVAGKIVVCQRGVTARVNKSLAVLEAGGVGMILINTTTSSINADFHFLPTVHLHHTDLAAVTAYAATPGATASIHDASIVNTEPAPFTASFSSRGPLLAAGGDLLKPDVIAPGQDILAAVAPPGNAGRLFDLYSGTSMSSPHVAGLAALLKDLHPDWSPMAIKSALMTSAYDVLDDVSPATKIFRQGAGHVDPNKAADPGLVFDAGWVNWLGFLCGTGQLAASYCPSIRIDPSNLNVASIAIGDLAGTQTVTRTVTNVGARETYTVSGSLSGAAVSVSPASFTLNPGASRAITITITRTTAPLNEYTGGSLTWTGSNGHVVRIPVVVRPVAIAAPAEVTGAAASGSLSFPITFGYSGSYAAGVHGLNAATTFDGTVADDPTDTFVVGGPGVVSFEFIVPAGTAYTRFGLFDENTDGEDDLDLYVYNGDTLVALSGGGTSAEQVNLTLPEAATYTVYVHGWQTDGPDANFTLFAWNVGLVDDAGNMTVTAPASAVIGVTGTVNVTWSGLDAGKRYLGAVSHNSPALEALTIVSVNVP